MRFDKILSHTKNWGHDWSEFTLLYNTITQSYPPCLRTANKFFAGWHGFCGDSSDPVYPPTNTLGCWCSFTVRRAPSIPSGLSIWTPWVDVPITHRDIVQTLRKEDFQISCQRDTAFKQTEKAGYIYRTGNKAPQNTAGGPRNIWACFPTKAMPTLHA